LVCGDSLIDSGGSTGVYTDNEVDTFYICPQTPGDAIQLNFLSFNIEQNYDYLTIYDSNQAGTNPIGTFTGAQTLGTFVAENPTGCLTVVFTSDGSVTYDGWVASITCVPAPTCFRPTNLQVSNVTSTSGTFSWQANDNEIRWVLEYGPAGFTPGTGTDVVSLTNPKTINTFSGLTNYDVYIRARCGIGDTSAYFGPINFTTSPAPLNCGDTFTDSGSDTANYQLNEDYIFTACPGLPTETVNVIFSEFDIDNGWDFMTIYDANDTISGTEIATYTGTNSPGIITAENATGCLTFRFTSDGWGTFPGWVASVNCVPAITCLKPTNITTSNATDVSIDLAWTANNGESAWQIQYGPAGFALGTGTVVNAGTNPFTVTGLTATTQYDFYVRSVCGTNDSSNYSLAVSATTINEPLVCGNTFTDLGGDANPYANGVNETYVICPTLPNQVVLLSFSVFETELNYDSLRIYNGSSMSDPLIGTFEGTNSPGNIYSTSPNGCLTVNFVSDGSVTYAGWVASIQCVDPITCLQPSNLIADATTSASVTLSWTANSGETQWLIEYDTTGFILGTGTTIVANSNPFEITGLNASTNYDFYVSAICSSSDSSFATGPLNAQTQLAPFICGNQFLDNGGLDNYANSSSDTTTICPNGNFEIVSVIFSEFDTESGFDSLMVFNGASTNDPLIGTYQGLDTLGTITSTNPNGCLTFVFVSDGSVTRAGWVGQIACIDANASIDENKVDLLTVYPNPSNGKFTVQNTQASLVNFELRDMQGRKLNLNKSFLSPKENTVLDLNSYENGIYFLVINGTQTLTLVKN
ncbi:MAG: CUB domain-containing protein, partial [Flavobacteriia bacterium]|jgi:hypothetical protein